MTDVPVLLRHDGGSDVLYVKRAGATIRTSREAAHDGGLIVNLDAAGAIVGVQLLAASELPAALWRNHPDRSVLPDDIARTIDAWLDARPPRAQDTAMREM